MFQQLKNIDTAFKFVRIFSIVILAVATCITCYSIESAYRSITEIQKHIYVIVNGKAFDAALVTKKENIPVEARDHLKTFHQFFFTLAPDGQAINSSINHALSMADESAKVQYDALKESGYYTNVITSGISQDITIDSIAINTDAEPYYFRFYGKERITRATLVLTRQLTTEGYLRNLQVRTDNNPHGFLIERWKILDNHDLKTDAR